MCERSHVQIQLLLCTTHRGTTFSLILVSGTLYVCYQYAGADASTESALCKMALGSIAPAEWTCIVTLVDMKLPV